eukprot:6456762-Prorocentrum_lima.AAC.1
MEVALFVMELWWTSCSIQSPAKVSSSSSTTMATSSTTQRGKLWTGWRRRVTLLAMLIRWGLNRRFLSGLASTL